MPEFDFKPGNFKYPAVTTISNEQIVLISNANPQAKDKRVFEWDMLVFDNSIISVLVGTGSGKADFRVHRTLFTSRSKFFERATSNDSQGKDELLVTLLDEDPQTFRLYLNLVYANQLATRGPEQWPKLCQLYVLAERLQDTKSKNEIVEGMYSFLNELLLKPWSPSTRSKHYLPAVATAILFEGMTEKSRVRALLVDFYADFGDEILLREAQAELPADFIYDVAVRLLGKRAHVIFGSQIVYPPSHYYEFSNSLLENTGTVTGKTKEVSTNSKDSEPEPKPGSVGAATSQVETRAVENLVPLLKALTMTVK
ncbi:hypothetical protein AG0111_0g6179 [Alternaria gaisen]|uniref:Uncharacterized protein n=1 Tax=Alternaria gaisen TaxID=167740 RepID=A0ACB6FNG2_9PLEO|nr:hypothetical protein AG0111_0g6179 [Alternaria gaisen]